jgi:hypothetical protein
MIARKFLILALGIVDVVYSSFGECRDDRGWKVSEVSLSPKKVGTTL